jgi:hypothetical protein
VYIVPKFDISLGFSAVRSLRYGFWKNGGQKVIDHVPAGGVRWKDKMHEL